MSIELEDHSKRCNCPLSYTIQILLKQTGSKIGIHHFALIPELPNQFLVPLEDKTITEGETAKFSCETSKPGKPTWKRNGRELRESDRIKMDSSINQHTLTIRNGVVEDEANYTCEIKNESTSAKLKVKELSVEIISPMKDQYVKEGETATFVLNVSKPSEAIQWLKEDREIRRYDARYKTSIEDTKLILTVLDAELGDEAMFTCHVGDKKSSARLYVEGLKKLFLEVVSD